MLQPLSEATRLERLQFCRKVLRDRRSPQKFRKLFFSDEAHFLHSGHVNKQNMRYWSREAPHAFVIGPRSTKKLTVWCAVGYAGIVGPYFFEDEHGETVTVNSQRYIAMLEQQFIPDLERMTGVNMRTVRFQQDGAPPHTANITLAALADWFPGERLISRRTNSLCEPLWNKMKVGSNTLSDIRLCLSG